MNFTFADERPADADAIIFAVTKNGLDGLELNLEQAKTVKAGAQAARFEGKLGEVFEIFVNQGDAVLRIVLTGLGEGKASDAEFAGGSAIAKIFRIGLQTCRGGSLWS